jgi:hypothetical protein
MCFDNAALVSENFSRNSTKLLLFVVTPVSNSLNPFLTKFYRICIFLKPNIESKILTSEMYTTLFKVRHFCPKFRFQGKVVGMRSQ